MRRRPVLVAFVAGGLLAACSNGSRKPVAASAATTVAAVPSTSSTISAASSTSLPAGSVAPPFGRPDRCHTSQLAATDDGATTVDGNAMGEIVFRNISGQVCTMLGYPGLLRLDASRATMATNVIRDGSRNALVSLAPQQQASAGYTYPTASCPGPATAAPAAFAELTPPDERDFIVVRSGLAPCDSSGTVHFTAVRPGKGSALPGSPATVKFPGTYTGWTWPPAPSPGFRSLALSLTVATDPGPPNQFFFAHQVGFANGDGGYIGLQEGTEGKLALFSVFHGCDENAPAASCPPHGSGVPLSVPVAGGSCNPLTNSAGIAPEGPGQRCRIPFAWEARRAYDLVIASAGPALWQASVVDVATGAAHVIGTVRVPSTWGGLRSDSVSWIEYFGPQLTSCSALPKAGAVWDTARASLPQASIVGPLSAHSYLGNLGDVVTCSNSSVTDTVGSSPGAVQTTGG